MEKVTTGERLIAVLLFVITIIWVGFLIWGLTRWVA